jgi:HAD superfamily hydrolase (TIGR01549 family)
VSEEQAARAIGAEIAYYRAHLDEARDAAGLAGLRARCTEVLREALPAHAREVSDLQDALLGALRFRAYPEVPQTLTALRAQGARLVVVSNWDVSLHEVLERTGLAPLVDGVVTSAEHGAAKPDPSIFRAGLEIAGAGPEEAVHVGDDADADVAGARGAGIEPVLIARDGAQAPDGTRTITSLSSLVPQVSTPTWEIQPERPEPPVGPPPPEQQREGERGWPPWTAPIALVAALVVAFLGGAIVSVFVLAFGGEVDDFPPGALMAATLLQDIGFVAAAIIFARMTTRPLARHFGLRPTRVGRAIGLMFAVYIGFIVLSAVWTQLIDLSDPAEDQLDDLGVDSSDLALAAAAVLVCVVAPVVEEFFFRGFFYAALRNWRGVWPAAIFTGLIFGGIHFGSAEAGALVPLALLGVGLCLLYEWTDSLYPCIALHAVNNSLAFGYAVDWEWQIPLLLFGSLLACAALTVPAARRWRGA